MNTVHSYNKNNCRLCNSSNLKTIYRLKKTPIGDDYTKKIAKKKLYDLKLNVCKNANLFNYQMSLIQIKFMEITYTLPTHPQDCQSIFINLEIC